MNRQPASRPGVPAGLGEQGRLAHLAQKDDGPWSTKGVMLPTGKGRCRFPPWYHLWTMRTVHEAAGGDAGLRLLARAWHARVMADDVVSHAFSHGFHPQHSERLAAYWAEALGGPTQYSDLYGNESVLVRMHSGSGEHDEMDRRAIACFDAALADVGMANDP